MYEVNCERCGRVGFHPSRVGAQLKARTHREKSDHDVGVDPMD